MSRSAYGRNGLRFCAGLLGVFAVAMFIVAAQAIFQRPRTYRSLAEHGVPALASVHCGRDDCELTYTYAGREHTNRYGSDLDQFCHCGAPTPVLVDPRDPATMFTVRDVQRGTNAGLGVYSVATILIGLFMGGLGVCFFIALRSRPDRPPPSEPLRWDASPASRTLHAIDEVQEQLDWAHALPGYRWYRVDRDKLDAGVAEMRSSIARFPGPRAQALDAADRVAREVRAAPRIPVIGGACVRADQLSDQLDEIRLETIAAVRSR